MEDNFIEFKDVYKRYQMGEVTIAAANGVNFHVKPGEFVVIVGPSGAGKSTILNMLGGIDQNDDGQIIIGGKDLSAMNNKELTLYRRYDIGFVFQFYNLIQNLTAKENVEIASQICKEPMDAEEALRSVGLEDRMDNFPSQLSGGEQQRVAIARALANNPKVLLLDEPLGALDLKLRKDMQTELKNIHQKTGITFILVTHDQEEALSMSDTVVVMDKGRIQQIGTPEDIYNEPENAFVADFIGESNIIDGVMLEDYHVKFSGREFDCIDKGFGKMKPIDVVIRPEDIKVTTPENGYISGKVTSVTFKGVHNEIIVDVNGFKWMIQTTESQEPGDEIGMIVYPDDIHIMNKSSYSSEVGDYSAFSDEFYEEQHQKN